MDRLQAMEVFVNVVDSGSFTRAAERLRLPKATATTLVQHLESHLRVKLLNRTTRRVTVTADGAAYYERCVRILADVQETESVLARTTSTPRGRLRVDVLGSFGRYVLIPALPEFFERYPDIQLEVGCGDRPVDLIEEGVDCVVRGGGPNQDPTLVGRKVASCSFITCAHRDYLLKHGVPRTPEDLMQHRCINYFSSKTGKAFEWAFTREGERQVVSVSGNLAINDGDAYLSAGLHGLGIMQVPLVQVQGALARGDLVRLLPDWSLDVRSVYVLYPQNRHLSAKVRVFVDWIAELFAERWNENKTLPNPIVEARAA